MSKWEVLFLASAVGAFSGCVSGILVLLPFWPRLSERNLRKAMTIAAIGGAIGGLLSVAMGENAFPLTLWRGTVGAILPLSGAAELLGAACASAWLTGGILAFFAALRELGRGGAISKCEHDWIYISTDENVLEDIEDSHPTTVGYRACRKCRTVDVNQKAFPEITEAQPHEAIIRKFLSEKQ